MSADANFDQSVLDTGLKLLKLASLGGRVKSCATTPAIDLNLMMGWLERSLVEDPCWLYITKKGVEKVLSMKQ